MKFQVFIDDNFHYMDPEHQLAGPQFATLEEAVGYCERAVDDFLISNYQLPTRYAPLRTPDTVSSFRSRSVREGR